MQLEVLHGRQFEIYKAVNALLTQTLPKVLRALFNE
jgi:hypothetical protein